MRALVMTAPGGSEFSEIAELEAPRPGPGEVTIDVAYAGVNFMDVMARRGDPGYARSWPYVAGIEVSGTVREVGAGVTALSAGERVAAVTPGGGFAEVALARAELAARVPAELPLDRASAAPTGLATALLLIDVARFAPGDSVLVHSASGGLGGALARVLRHRGAGRLIGTVGRPDKVAVAEKSGYDKAIARDDTTAEAILRANGGRGVQIILDPLGTSALELDLEVVAAGGAIVLFGNAPGGAPAPLPPAGRLIGGNITVSGFSHRGLSAAAPDRVSDALHRALDLVAAEHIALPVTVLDSLAEIPEVHQLMAEGRGTGKYVVRVAGAAPARGSAL